MTNVGSPQTQLNYLSPFGIYSPSHASVQTATIPYGTIYMPYTSQQPTLNKPLPMGIQVTRDITNYPGSVLFMLDFAIVNDQQGTEMSFQILIQNPTIATFSAIVSNLGPGFSAVQISQILGKDGAFYFFTVSFNADFPSIFLPNSFDNHDTYLLGTAANN